MARGCMEVPGGWKGSGLLGAPSLANEFGGKTDGVADPPTATDPK